MAEAFKFGFVGLTVLGLAFIVAMSLPQSRLREFLLPIVAWTFTAVCGIGILSPVDAIPDVIPMIGWMDDGMLVAGLASAVTAIRAGKSKG